MRKSKKGGRVLLHLLETDHVLLDYSILYLCMFMLSVRTRPLQPIALTCKNTANLSSFELVDNALHAHIRP